MHVGMNPNYCWVFSNKTQREVEQQDPKAKKKTCCHLVEKNADIADSLKGIVELKDDGM